MPRLLAIVASLLLPVPAWAAKAATLEFEVCETDIGLNCTVDLPRYVVTHLLGGSSNIYTAFFGITFAMLVFYGVRLAITSRSENSTQEAIAAYVQALAGVMLVSGSMIITQAFTQHGVVADVPVINDGLREVVNFVVRIIGILLALNLLIQGIRFIIAINEGNVDNARRNLIQSFIGAAVVILAAPIIDFIVPGSFDSSISKQFVGIANFLATLFGFFAVIAIIVAGIMLIVSVDEGLRDRAKRLILSALIAVGVVASAAGIIQILL